MFASEEEQGSESSVGLGLGAVLAILASPGAFASIFLMGKYSTLLQWLRGHRIDAIRSSPADEYFFVVLSMTITGLVMVARWNRLFPDARDFTNLATLPIPIRDIFLANFAALFGLALLIGLDVNIVSALLFPFFVTISIGTASAFLRVAVSHAATVFSASLFSFFAVFALVGILMLVVPRRISRPVSVVLRLILVIGLLTEFFSNILLQLFAGRLPGGAGAYMRWVPSFWFLGIYERTLAIANTRMAAMAEQGLLATGGGDSCLHRGLCALLPPHFPAPPRIVRQHGREPSTLQDRVAGSAPAASLSFPIRARLQQFCAESPAEKRAASDVFWSLPRDRPGAGGANGTG